MLAGNKDVAIFVAFVPCAVGSALGDFAKWKVGPAFSDSSLRLKNVGNELILSCNFVYCELIDGNGPFQYAAFVNGAPGEAPGTGSLEAKTSSDSAYLNFNIGKPIGWQAGSYEANVSGNAFTPLLYFYYP